MSFYLILAAGTMQSVRCAARLHGVRLRRIEYFARGQDGTVRNVIARVAIRYGENLRQWYDASSAAIKTAEAALTPEQRAIYEDSNEEARFALVEKGVLPAGFLNRFDPVVTPVRDGVMVVLKGIGILLLLMLGGVAFIL